MYRFVYTGIANRQPIYYVESEDAARLLFYEFLLLVLLLPILYFTEIRAIDEHISFCVVYPCTSHYRVTGGIQDVSVSQRSSAIVLAVS